MKYYAVLKLCQGFARVDSGRQEDAFAVSKTRLVAGRQPLRFAS
jgi:hypothetical protein